MDQPKDQADDAPPPVSWSEQKSYDFDNWYCTDPNAQVICLIIVNIVCVVVLGVLFAATGSMADKDGLDFMAEVTWMAWGQLSGTGGSPDGWLWSTRFVGVLNALMGMFVFSLICAFIEDAINAKLEGLRKGRSKVVENGFSLIIGWSDRILPLCQQLCLANESNGGGPIVILADVDKEEMDAFFQDNISDSERLGSRIVTRRGQPIDIFSLRKVNAMQARSIVCLSVEFDADEADAQACRTVLALTGALTEYGGLSGHVVVELRDVDNEDIVRLGIQNFDEARDLVKPLVANDLTGRLMIQCALQPGLARVFSHILAFSGNEFYFKDWEKLTRRRFADVCFMFNDAVPIGIKLAEEVREVNEEDGTVNYLSLTVNPPGDYVIEDGDQIIVIAEDDDSYFPGQMHMVETNGPAPNVMDPEPEAVTILLIGFRRDLDDMINEIDKWVAPGSIVYLFSDTPVDERMQILMAGGLNESFDNITLEHFVGNPIFYKDVLKVRPAEKSATIVLTEKAEDKDGLTSDSRTLVTSLLVRHLQKLEYGRFDMASKCTLVCEILDPRTENLLSMASANDFICANDFVSMALGQIAEEPSIHTLIYDLFSPEGSEMHIKPIYLYTEHGSTLNFWELTALARTRAEICLGYVLKGSSSVERVGDRTSTADWNDAGNYPPYDEPVLNPFNKDKRITFWEGDMVIVLSED
eukprot:TRINITY_DN10537_c0_g1_i2.p1 TRINITY_DN10537_c0_g1~~TRINITY_DN10537_c0_g1_i2.p1  ORF type:complete len:697 (-),score=201.21 TRINITY_DN10537_c0_g1_i2:14-2104(-)